MPSPPLPVPAGGDVNRATILIAIYWAQTSVALIFICLRVWARQMIHGLGIDDWTMLLTMALFIILSVVVTLIGLAGGDRHLYYIVQDPVNTSYILKLSFISQFFAIMTVGVGKASVAFLILRLVKNHGSKWRKWALWGTIVSTIVFSALCAIFTFYQCENPVALWDPEVALTTKCWRAESQADFSIFSSSWNVFLDFFLALLPVGIIWDLQLNLRKKIGICVLLGLGIFAGVCASIKTSYLVNLSSRGDPTWATYDLYIWACTEILLTIVCGSVPAVKPLYDRYISQKSVRSYGSSYEAGTQMGTKKSYTAKKYASVSDDYLSQRDIERDNSDSDIRMDTIITYDRSPGKLSGEDGGRAEARAWSDTTPIIEQEKRVPR